MNPNLVTIITGGGRGIGRAIALRMASLTAILVVGRTKADLESVCQEINQAGGISDFVVGDVSEQSTAEAAMLKAHEHGWSVRNLVCNAGIGKGGPVVSFDPAVWRSMFEVNVNGTFYFIQACLPAMIERKQGAISIISSVSGLKGHKNDAAYSATKFALVGLAQSLADELKKHNIVVIPLCPGFVEGDMTGRTISGLMHHQNLTQADAERRIAQANPQGRILQAVEIAEAVAYCSTAAPLAESGKSLTLTQSSDSRVLQLVNWVHANAARANQLIIPISGGSDSALSFAICARAYPSKVRGVFVGSPETLRCREWFESIGKVEYLAPAGSGQNGEINRWAQFLALSIGSGGWLTGSRTATEEATGLFSLASRVATFLPLARTWKSQVMELCDLIGVPKAITASSRRADPDCGRPQELAEIPLEQIDTFLRVRSGLLPESALATLTCGQRDYLARVVEQNEFKRHLPTTGPSLLVL